MKIETKEDTFKYKDGREKKYIHHSVEYKGVAFWLDANDDEPELYDMIAALISTGEFYISDDDDNILKCWVNCSDVFAWGCADAENILPNEIRDLFFMVIEDNKWGATKWSCIKRNERPQIPIEKDMKLDNAWCDKMEALPLNKYWQRLAERKRE